MHEPTLATPIIDGQAAPAGPAPRLLIVDDISDNRAVLSRRFARRGYVVSEADCGAKALEIVTRETFDCVLLDVMMGDMDGRDVLREIRKTFGPHTLPIIMVTARTQSEDVVEALNLGANDYITKPVDFGVALARVQTQVGLRQAEERAREANEALLRANATLESRIAERTAELVDTNARLRRAVAEAEAANRSKDEFLANISHELRTPLNGVSGMAQMLRLTALDASQRQMLEVIETSAGALRTVVTDLLDIVDMSAGRVELAPEPTDLAQLCGAVASLAQVDAKGKGLALACQIAPDVGSANVDAARLRQVLLNLLSNAVKFTDSGQVTFSVTRGQAASDTVTFTVSDTGIGFDPAETERLFERFHQADGSLTRRVGGVGLGLFICRELVEQMGGRITAEGRPGAGATFTVELPLAERREAGEPPLQERRLCILCVDDHPTNRKVLEMVLSAAGISTTMVENGAEAVSAFQGGKYDAVLMDMQMPVMDGLTATRAIRDLEAVSGRSRTPVVMLTAHGLPEHRRASQAAGADRHVTKPIVAGELLDVVGDLITEADGSNQAVA